MHVQVDDLQRMSEAVTKAKAALFKLTLDDGSEALDHWLTQLERELDTIETFIREETFARWGEFDTTTSHAALRQVPDGVSYTKLSDTVSRFEFPVWLFRPRSKVRPPYHRRSFIRENQFWWALIRFLVPREERYRQVTHRETEPEFATCQVTLQIHRRFMCADWDKFNIHSLLNALAAHSVIASDHPSCLSLAYTYCFVEQGRDEKLVVQICRHDDPVTAKNGTGDCGS